MKTKELAKLVSKGYKINAAMAMETAAQLMKHPLWDFRRMSEDEINETLTMIEEQGS